MSSPFWRRPNQRQRQRLPHLKQCQPHLYPRRLHLLLRLHRKAMPITNANWWSSVPVRAVTQPLSVPPIWAWT
jgi:hypothetical protein